MRLRIAVLYASVGTGHKTAALSLTKWFKLEYPDCEVLCIDTLAYALPLVKGFMTRSYLEMVKRVPRLWGYFYDSTDTPEAKDGFLGTLNDMTERLNLIKLKRNLLDFAPSAVLFTHFFGAGPLAEALSPDIPVFYVNTDFLSHVFHRNPAFSGWYVGSREALYQYWSDGIDGRVAFTGIPIDPVFAFPPSRREARKRLGLSCEEKSILVMSGGIGVGPMEEVLESLSQAKDLHVTAITGINAALFRNLRQAYKGFPRMRILGFVNNIADHYAASDLIIMKPGGLSSSEALCIGRPILLMDPIPGQEQRNSDYLLDRGAARSLFEYRATHEKVSEILEDGEGLARLRLGMASIARPFAGRTIARSIVSSLVRSGVLF